VSTFLASTPDGNAKEYGATEQTRDDDSEMDLFRYRLYRCAGCKHAGLGELRWQRLRSQAEYRDTSAALVSFYPNEQPTESLPDGVPNAI
jgi:hypothetical protein